jgi:hypothetical protein
LNEKYTYEGYEPTHGKTKTSSSNNESSLDSIAEGIQTTSKAEKESPGGRVSTSWEERKKDHLTDVNDTYD